MILDNEIKKVVVNGKTTYDFGIFRIGKKHLIGMYDEINSFVSFVKMRLKAVLPKKWPLCWWENQGTVKPFLWNFYAVNIVNF